jgi:hypothetical protein
VSSIARLNETTEIKIDITNTSNSKLVLNWIRISNTLPNIWQYTTCDNVFCYGGVPSGTKTMDTIPIGGQSFLNLGIEPGNDLGLGQVKIYVYQEGYYSQGDTLTWNISTTAVGINEYTDSDLISMYPNPVSEILNILLKKEFNGSKVRIIDFMGRKIMEQEITGLFNTIDVSRLAKGNYFLVIENNEHLISKRFIRQ